MYDTSSLGEVSLSYHMQEYLGLSEYLICFYLMDMVIHGIFLFALTARKLKVKIAQEFMHIYNIKF